ncbi:MAG: hypothetical protein M3409_02480 [Gemmatimonadota bacterium]|nr:hypothetical protein [Gemmatimonadota bacterium]
MHKTIRRAIIPFAMIAAFAATDAEAQGRGRGAEKERGKVEQKQQEKERRDWELRRRDEQARRDGRTEDGRRRGVPPGWCIGRGNPHNTVENCGRSGERYDRRYDTRRDGDRRDGRSGATYEQRYADYLRYQDAQCRARSDDRPLDLLYRLQVKRECDRARDEWIRRNDPNRGG